MAWPAIAAGAAKALKGAGTGVSRFGKGIGKGLKKRPAAPPVGKAQGKERIIPTLEYVLFALPLAAIKDVIDLGNFTGIWLIVSITVGFIVTLIFFLYFTFWVKGIKLQKLLFRFLIAIVADFFSLVLPLYIIFVTWLWMKKREI